VTWVFIARTFKKFPGWMKFNADMVSMRKFLIWAM
jgi:hypothetical protein